MACGKIFWRVRELHGKYGNMWRWLWLSESAYGKMFWRVREVQGGRYRMRLWFRELVDGCAEECC